MPQIIQRSFTGGEIAPALRSRADLVKYSTGLALCQNFIVRSQGGVYSRPGTRFVGEIGNSLSKARLIPFTFNTDQTYILVFEHLKLRIIMNGGFVLSGGAIYEVTTQYTAAQLSRLSFTQDADVMTIVHPDHPPRTLSRTDHAAWAIDTIDFGTSISPPQWVTVDIGALISNITNDFPATVTFSSAHGLTTDDYVILANVGGIVDLNFRSFQITVVDSLTVTLNGVDTSKSPAFAATTPQAGAYRDDVQTIGTLESAGTYSKSYQYVVTAVGADGSESLPSASRTKYTRSLSSTYGINMMWLPVTGAEYYRVYKDAGDNTDTYGFIGESVTPLFSDYNIAPDTSDSPPQSRNPFIDVDSRPSCVAYYQQRQIYANTRNQPQTVFTSQTGIYNSMRSSIPARATDAITFTLKGRQVSEIRHIVTMDSMLLLTSGGEARVTEGQDQVLTPSTVGVRIQSYNGASWVPPVVIDDSVIYVQEKGARLRDMKHSYADDQYGGTDLSLMAEHLFEGYEILEMAYAAEPFGILWVVRSDGVLLGLTYQREHQVWAWHQHTTDGKFESVAVISEGGRDAVYVTVNRTINGVTKRYVERMEPRFTTSAEDAFCVDSGLTYSGSAVTTISGLGHLEGKQVAVVADGNEVKGLTVAGGSVTLPRAASKVHAGLAYLPAIELLDIDVSSTVDTLKGRTVTVSNVILEVDHSRGGWVGPISEDGSTDDMVEIKPRFSVDGYGPIALKTFKAEVVIHPQWSRGGGVRIEQRAPMPLAILSVIPTIDVSN